MPSGLRNSSTSISPGATGLSRVRSVVVDNFDLFGISVHPDKAKSVSIIDSKAPLAHPVAAQRFKPVTRRYPQILQPLRRIQLHKFPKRDALERLETRY